METHLGSQTDDLPPSLHSQVCTDDPTDTRAQHLALVVQEDRGIVVEANVPAIWPAHGLLGSDDDSLAHVPPAHFYGIAALRSVNRPRTLHHADDLVADAAPAVVDLLLEYVDALDQECS